MYAEGDGSDSREKGLEDHELHCIIAEVLALANRLHEAKEELGIRACRPVSLTANVGMGDQLLDAINGGFGDLEEARGGGVNKWGQDGFGIDEGQLGGAVVKWARRVIGRRSRGLRGRR